MAGHKETPRQRMIAIMYLVMTSLLALNVSKDVINAFVVVNENIVTTNKNFSNKLDDVYTDFEKNYQFNKLKVAPFWEKAQQARLLSEEMEEYVRNVRYELISMTEGVSLDSAKLLSVVDLKKKDNNTIPTNYFIGNGDDGSGGKAMELKERLVAYRNQMLELIPSEYKDHFEMGLSTDGPYYNADGQKQSWEIHYFYNTILAADIPLLNKIISDIYNAEYDVVNLLYKSIGQGDFKFDKIEAKVLPRSNFVYMGDTYQADIIVAAYDTTQSPDVYVLQGADNLTEANKAEAVLLEGVPGRISLQFPAQKEGLNKFAGFVRARSGNGLIRDYYFDADFMVARPSITISAKKMNVFYSGVDNPVSISISGIPPEDMIPSISCGSIKPDAVSGDWLVNIPAGFTTATISISANIDGSYRILGNKVFRVKRFPDPIASIANKSSGSIKKEIIMAAGRISAKMPSDFEFAYPFEIQSFAMSIQRGFRVYHYEASDAYLTDEMIEQIKKTNRGQNIVFEAIEAIDPDGLTRRIPPIILSIN